MITILLFAANRESAGTDKIELEAAGSSVRQLKEQLELLYPGSAFKHSMAAIDESFVPDEALVKAGDTVAFIPPVSGG
ncbi:molybdopterin converting factor subunit 1 [Metabacillus sp. 84]|uniref:molybdopterin converting factor subunit 1 n=1 Tax=unclassified Metabacillus TaxID=2675274 RepID=UPI003CE6A8FD